MPEGVSDTVGAIHAYLNTVHRRTYGEDIDFSGYNPKKGARVSDVRAVLSEKFNVSSKPIRIDQIAESLQRGPVLVAISEDGSIDHGHAELILGMAGPHSYYVYNPLKSVKQAGTVKESEIIIQKDNLLALLCLCTFAAGQARAFPAAAAANAEPLTWPDHGPYQKVGRPDGVLGTLKMPVPVVAAVQRRVAGDPSIWGLYPIEQYPGQPKRIINVASRAGGYLCLLAAHGTWTILSVPTVNEVLDPLVPADLQNHAKLDLYFAHIV